MPSQKYSKKCLAFCLLFDVNAAWTGFITKYSEFDLPIQAIWFYILLTQNRIRPLKENKKIATVRQWISCLVGKVAPIQNKNSKKYVGQKNMGGIFNYYYYFFFLGLNVFFYKTFLGKSLLTCKKWFRQQTKHILTNITQILRTIEWIGIGAWLNWKEQQK